MQIDKGVKVPVSYRKVAKDMEVGDSVVIDNWQGVKSLRSAIYSLNMKPVSRKENGNWRVWKKEK